MLKKNEIIELEITDMGVNGEGIGRFEGCTFFVKNAVIGDKVKAVITRMKKGYGYARMLEALRPSEFRIQAPCENAARCGGCQIMELDYPEQLRFKERKVETNLRRIGGMEDIPLLPIIGMEAEGDVPVRYRNKMQFPIGRNKDGAVTAGFYAGRTHHIIDTDACIAAPEVSSRILRFVKSFIREYRIPVYNEETGQGLIRHLVLRTGFRTGEVMVCLVLKGKSLNDFRYAQDVDMERIFVDKLLALPLSEAGKEDEAAFWKICSICINSNQENTNVILGKTNRTLYGKGFIYDEICDQNTGKTLKFKISPLSFFQVNPVQTEKLYAKALEFADLSGKETVWDLYCGIGTISLFLAGKSKQVKGVEIVPDAIRDAEENAKLNGISNAEFFCGKSEEVFPAYSRLEREEGEGPANGDLVVVLDPPRKGCDRVLLDAIMEVGPEKIVYISCDSATLARDLKILTEGISDAASPAAEKTGTVYRVEKVQPVDMFPNSGHVETVCLLYSCKNRTNSFAGRGLEK